MADPHTTTGSPGALTERPEYASATAWLREYHGSIDATALLLAFRAGQLAGDDDSRNSDG